MRYQFLLLGLFSFTILSAPIQKVLPLSVTIDKSHLYSYTLSLDMQSNDLTLLFNKNLNRFQSEEVPVIVSTDIPNDKSGIGFEYTLSLISNESHCLRPYDGSITQEGFISLKLDNVPLESGDILEGQPLNKLTEGVLGSERVLELDSDIITAKGVKCDGQVRLEAELTL